MLLNQPLSAISSHGDKTAELLARCGVETLRDLLTHLPLRYEDRSPTVPGVWAAAWAAAAARWARGM